MRGEDVLRLEGAVKDQGTKVHLDAHDGSIRLTLKLVIEVELAEGEEADIVGRVAEMQAAGAIKLEMGAVQVKIPKAKKADEKKGGDE